MNSWTLRGERRINSDKCLSEIRTVENRRGLVMNLRYVSVVIASRTPALRFSLRVAPWTLVALAACMAPSAEVVSLSPAAVLEGTSAQLTLQTRGGLPAFDLGSGRTVSDPPMSLHLGPQGPTLPATRVAAERFAVTLPDTLVPGAYPVQLVLGDGRVAEYHDSFVIVPQDLRIKTVESPRTVLSFGETGVAVAVTVSNPSACAIHGLSVRPTFEQGTEIRFPVRGPATVDVPPHSDLRVDFDVDVSSVVAAGRITVNAAAQGGTRAGWTACTGSVAVSAAAAPLVWIVVPTPRQSLTIASVRLIPPVARLGADFPIDVTVRNDATVPLTLESLEWTSTPPGIVPSRGTALPPRSMPPGASVNATVSATTNASAVAGANYTVTLFATARNAAGDLYASPVGGSLGIQLSL